MKYMLMIYRADAEIEALTQDQGATLFGAFMAYTKAMREADVYVAGDPLQMSSTATTVRVANGKTTVLNGPYAETKEQLGGYYIIDVTDLDAALSWAARCPGATMGTIEVRPLMVFA
jgi:hypothetical protein